MIVKYISIISQILSHCSPLTFEVFVYHMCRGQFYFGCGLYVNYHHKNMHRATIETHTRREQKDLRCFSRFVEWKGWQQW